MKLLYFIRLLLKHSLLLIMFPVAMAVLVFFATKDLPKVYVSNTRVYTGIATGTSIASLDDSKIDLFATRAAFDNLIEVIKSKSTLEEVSMRLMARYLMLDGPEEEYISPKAYAELMELVPDEVKKLVVKNNLSKTLENFRTLKNKNHTNFIYEVLNYEHPYYSTLKIGQKIKVTRIQSSDIVDIRYESDDPGICKNTLELLVDVFIEEYTNIKINQSDAVVRYFQTQLDQSDEKLNKAENELLKFNQSNNIINYYEQTKHVASEKEYFDLAYQEIQRSKAAAESVLSILESKMSEQQKRMVNNERILDLRNQLSQINTEIALKTYQEQSDSTQEDKLIREIADLKTRAFDIQEELKKSVKLSYNLDNTIEGLPNESVLGEWLTNVIELESAKSKLVIADFQKKEYERLFTEYAPLGATMKRLERKINVAEREYLSILQSLGHAKLKQQNIELNSNLKVLVPAFFPIMAQPSKRKLLLIVAFMMGFMIPAFIIIVLDFLDTNLKTWERTEKLTGLSVSAVYPNTCKVSKRIDLEFIKHRNLEIITRRLVLLSEKIGEKKKPFTFLFFSSLAGEGKTTLLIQLIETLANYDYKTLYISGQKASTSDNIDQMVYTDGKAFHQAEKIIDLVPESSENELAKYDYIFVEFPGVLTNDYPINLFKNIDFSILVIRANRAWLKSDAFAIQDINEQLDQAPLVLLNGVEIQEMENLIGELPRKRSFIRKFIKKLVLLKFNSKSKI